MASERKVIRVQGAASEPAFDAVAEEAPLVVRARGTQVLTMLRTPGADRELIAGLLHGEGLPPAAVAVLGEDVVDLDLDPTRFASRPLVATGACGACSKAMIADLQVLRGALPPRARDEDAWTVPAAVIAALPGRMLAAQREFAASGGLHAAALFSQEGDLLALREDIGRHNAVDKVIGWAVLAGRVPLRRAMLMLSGRCGFELIAKAAAAGLEMVAAISAPTTLAIDAAQRSGIALCGFVRGERFNVYAHGEKIVAHG